MGVRETSRLGVQVLDTVLGEVLHQNPTAQVMAVDGRGSVRPIPDSLKLTQQMVLTGAGSLHELVCTQDLAATSAAWARAQEVGVAQAAVRLASNDERRVSLYLIDARHSHGVVVCIIAASHDHLLPDLRQELLRPRHCTATKDQLGTFVSIDASTTRILGWAAHEIVGRRGLDFIHPDDVSKAVATWLDMLSCFGAERRARYRFRHRDGSWMWLEITHHNRLDDPEQHCVFTEMLDISEEMATQEALRVSEQGLLRLADALPLGVLQIDREHRVLYRNERLSMIVGRRKGTTAEDQLSNVSQSDCSQLNAALYGVLERGEDEDLEVRLQHRRGVRHCSIALRALTDQTGQVTGAIVCVADVTEDVRLHQELRNRANYDRLTHCYNRASILSALDKLLLEACLGETGTAAVFLDLDHFKPINDELGHSAGDIFLTRVAERLLDSVRSDDRVGRLGGDEFLVVCPDVKSPEDAVTIAERLAKAIRAPLEIDGRQLVPSASIGVAWSRNGDENADALVARADAAMYRSKSERRGRPALAATDEPLEGVRSQRPQPGRL